MPTATNVAAYQGRKFDLLALRGAKPVGEVLLKQTLFDALSSGEVCTGLQKLAQRWVLEFLTITGSIKYLPDRGCDFLMEAKHGLFRSELDVQQSFLAAAVPITANLQGEEDETWHPEDRFVRAELLSITLSGDFLSLTVNIVSRAGRSRQVILPIPLVPARVG